VTDGIEQPGIYSRRPGYAIPPGERLAMIDAAKDGPSFWSTLGAHNREYLGIGGTVSRAFKDPDLLLTGNEPVVTGVYEWGRDFLSHMTAGTDQHVAEGIKTYLDEWAEEGLQTLRTDVMGYTPTEGDYTGTLPRFSDDQRAERFIERLNGELTVEGRAALIRMYEQSQTDRETLNESGIGWQLLAGLVSAPWDEQIYADFFITRGVLTRARAAAGASKLYTILAASFAATAGAGATSAVREAILYRGIGTRTPKEVYNNIIFETAFGAILSGAAATMSVGYKSAVRRRFGEDTVPEALDSARSVMLDNIKARPALQGKIESLIESLRAGRNLDEDLVGDDAWNQILDGVNKNVVELVGLRRGSWGNFFFNKFFFFTPNMRMAISKSKEANRIIDVFTDTAIVKEGSTHGTSLERLKAMVELHAVGIRRAQRGIYDQAKSDGANFRMDLPVLDSGYDHFDIAVEMAYRRLDEKFDPNLTIMGPDGSGFQPFKTSDGKQLNHAAIKAIKEARKMFGEEQGLFDDMVVLAGMMTRKEVTDRKLFYVKTHGENFVHRIIDRQAVGQNRGEFLKLLKEGWEDLADKQRPELEESLARLQKAKLEAQEHLRGSEGSLAAVVEAKEELRFSRRRLREIERQIKEQKDLESGSHASVDLPTHKESERSMRTLFGESYRAARTVKNHIGGTVVVVRRGGDVHPEVRGTERLEDGWYLYYIHKGTETTGRDLKDSGVKYTKSFGTLKEAKEVMSDISESGDEAASRFADTFMIQPGDLASISMRDNRIDILAEVAAGTSKLPGLEVKKKDEVAFIEEMRKFIGDSDAESSVTERKRFIFEADEAITGKQAEIDNLTWDEDKAEAVWKGWATPSQGDVLSLVHTDPTMQRSLLIADRYVERFLRISSDAQRHNFYQGLGLKVVAFHRLAHGDTIQFQRETNMLMEEAHRIERSLRETADDMADEEIVAKHLRVIEIEDELSILTETQRLRMDVRMNSSYGKEELQKMLAKVTKVTDALRSARKAMRDAVDDDKEALSATYDKAYKEYTKLSKKVSKGEVPGSVEPEGKIRSDRILQWSSSEPPSSTILSAVSSNRSIHAEVIAWRMARVTDRVIEERTHAWQMSISQLPHKAILLREYIENIKAEPGRAGKHAKVKDRAISDLDIVHQRIFNTWQRVPENRLWSASVNLVRNYNFATNMGGVTFSSLPDIAMGLFVAGPGPFLAATYKYGLYKLKRLITNLPPDEKYWVQDLIYSQELVGTNMQGRAGSIASVKAEMAGKRSYSATDRLEQASEAAANATTNLILLNRWNGFWKSVNSLASASRISRIADDISKGKSIDRFWANRRGDKRFISHMRLNERDLLDIAKLNKKFGSVYENDMGGKFYQTKAEDWSGTTGVSRRRAMELRARVTASVTTAGEMGIITPGAGNVPGMADRTIFARVMLQFKKFFIVATEQLLIPLAQRMGSFDLTAYGTAAGLMVAGTMVTAGKDAMRGRETFPHISGTGGRARGSTKEQYYANVAKLAMNAVDRSGAMAILSEPWGMLESTTYPPSDILTQNLLGANTGGGLSRSQQKGWVEQMMGPTVGKLHEAWWMGNEALQMLVGGKPLNAKHLSRGRRFVPWQNVLPFTLLVDTGLSMGEAAMAYNTRSPWQKNWTPADFYWKKFKFIEHRLAPLLMDVDFTRYTPKTSIME